MRLRLPKRVLPYIEVVDGVLIPTQSDQRKGTREVNFQKPKKIGPANKEIKQVKQIGILKYNYSSLQTAEFHPLLRVSRDHSILQPKQLFRSLVHLVGYFVERMQS